MKFVKKTVEELALFLVQISAGLLSEHLPSGATVTGEIDTSLLLTDSVFMVDCPLVTRQ